MAYPGAPKDGKSDVDHPFLPERQGQAKGAFDRVSANVSRETPATERPTGNQGRVPESIKKHAPGMSLDMAGSPGKGDHARDRLTRETADARKQQMMEAGAKKIAKSPAIEQNKSKSQDKGRE